MFLSFCPWPERYTHYLKCCNFVPFLSLACTRWVGCFSSDHFFKLISHHGVFWQIHNQNSCSFAYCTSQIPRCSNGIYTILCFNTDHMALYAFNSVLGTVLCRSWRNLICRGVCSGSVHINVFSVFSKRFVSGAPVKINVSPSRKGKRRKQKQKCV